ncbi:MULTISPECIES: hypothetical protein [unclassified Anabaena]|uniref:hypothetical protein n=1 Tax=unclassified Anabaena TaxID=2619674 RepID=UPI000835A2A5|nr:MULTISPECIES: hypothetical protein [unclassified Anabaena]
MKTEEKNNSIYNQDKNRVDCEVILNEYLLKEIVSPKAYVTTPAEYCTNFKIEKGELLLELFCANHPGNIQNWVQISGGDNADFDWHGLQEDWLALLQGTHKVEVIELPKIDLKSVYQDVMYLKSQDKPINLASLQATNYQSYQELKEAGFTRIIELAAPQELDVNNIPILVIPQGVFHSAVTSNRCLMLNLGKKFGISSNYSEYRRLEYQTYAR